MALRKIKVVYGPHGVARIYRDNEWQEYRVVAPGESTYHTTDKEDAVATARVMVGLPARE